MTYRREFLENQERTNNTFTKGEKQYERHTFYRHNSIQQENI